MSFEVTQALSKVAAGGSNLDETPSSDNSSSLAKTVLTNGEMLGNDLKDLDNEFCQATLRFEEIARLLSSVQSYDIDLSAFPKADRARIENTSEFAIKLIHDWKYSKSKKFEQDLVKLSQEMRKPILNFSVIELLLTELEKNKEDASEEDRNRYQQLAPKANEQLAAWKKVFTLDSERNPLAGSSGSSREDSGFKFDLDPSLAQFAFTETPVTSSSSSAPAKRNADASSRMDSSRSKHAGDNVVSKSSRVFEWSSLGLAQPDFSSFMQQIAHSGSSSGPSWSGMVFDSFVFSVAPEPPSDNKTAGSGSSSSFQETQNFGFTVSQSPASQESASSSPGIHRKNHAAKPSTSEPTAPVVVSTPPASNSFTREQLLAEFSKFDGIISAFSSKTTDPSHGELVLVARNLDAALGTIQKMYEELKPKNLLQPADDAKYKQVTRSVVQFKAQME